MFLCKFSGNHITTYFTFLQIPGAVSKMQVNIGRRNCSVTGNDNLIDQVKIYIVEIDKKWRSEKLMMTHQ